MHRVRQYVPELNVNTDLCKAETPAPVSCFIYRCLVFPLLCYSSTGLHLNYTLALQQSSKLNFISRSTGEMLMDVSQRNAICKPMTPVSHLAFELILWK